MASIGEILGVALVVDGIQKFNKNMKSAEKAVDDAAGGMEASGKQAKSFGDRLTDVSGTITTVTAGVAAFTGAWNKIMDFGMVGAQVNVTTDSFERMRIELGQSDDYLKRLREASKGTITDMKLMAGATTLVAGTTKEFGSELFSAYPQLIEYAKAASKLNPALGDTSFMLESIATGIKRGSPLILDNLGLVVKIGEANKIYADKLGKTVTQLTAEDKQMALLNATMKAGDRLVEQVGGTTDAATDSFERMNVSTENLKNEIASGLAPWIARAADAFTLLLTGNKKIVAAFEEQKLMVAKTTYSYEDYLQKIQWIIDNAQEVGFVIEALTEEQWKNIDATEHSSEMLNNNYYAAKFAAQGLEELDVEIESTTEELALLHDEQIKVADGFMSALGSSQSLVSQLLEAAAAEGASIESLALLAFATGEYTEEQLIAALQTMAMTEKIKLLAQQIAAGLPVEDALTQLSNYKAALDAIPSKITTTIVTKYKTIGAGPNTGATGDSYSNIYQSGTTEVPENMNAFLHGGEMVIPANQARVLRQMIRGDTNNNYNLTTQSITQPGGLRLEFDAMEASHR